MKTIQRRDLLNIFEARLDRLNQTLQIIHLQTIFVSNRLIYTKTN